MTPKELPPGIKTADEILRHPRYAEARRAHVDALIRFVDGDRFATRLMLDAATMSLRALIVAYHAAHRDADRSTWATLGHIQKVMSQRGLASPRRIDDLLARFRQIGYVESVPAPADSRVRVLKPTEVLVLHDRAHLAANHRFLHVLYPDRGYDWPTRSDAASIHLAIRRTGQRSLERVMAFVRHQAFMKLLSHDAGYLAFLIVAQSELSNDPQSLSFTAIGDRLGVSRTHVRNLFMEAEKAGFVRRGPQRKRPVEILPSLWQAYDVFLADVQADQDAICQSAFAEMRAEG
jgi:DNA-binding MarR family transcriptional regulator